MLVFYLKLPDVFDPLSVLVSVSVIHYTSSEFCGLKYRLLFPIPFIMCSYISHV